MGLFTGTHIALEFDISLGFKKKQEVRKLITANDGIVSFIITKKVTNIFVKPRPIMSELVILSQ